MHPLNLKPAFLALLAAMAFSPWTAGAFDWPEKPTAEVKADLIAYAKSVGHGEFAATIELGHSVGHRESYREMYERKDRLGAQDVPWPRVYPLGFGESVIWR